MKQTKHELKPLKKDRRDFRLGQYYELPKLEELPDEFIFPAFESKNQRQSDFCTAYTTCLLSELQDGVRLEPAWSFAVSKFISGDKDSWGQDLRTAFKAHTKYGAIEEEDCPYNVQSNPIAFLRDIKNYPTDLWGKALKHKKQSYFLVQGKYDAFDNIRASIWFFKDFKQGVGAGLLWAFPVDQAIIPNAKIRNGSGHALPYIGWKKIDGEIYLVARNSYGKSAGENGDFYLPREVVNQFAEIYGIFMMIDVSPEEVKKELWRVLEKLKDLLMKLLEAIKEKPQIPKVEPKPEPKPEPPKPESMQEMVLRVAGEEKLTAEMKEKLYQTIKCESNFDPKAVHVNRNGTSDYGICQYNSYWYIGRDKPIPSVEVALNDPEFCVRVMCKMWKRGRQRDWICYRKLFE